MQLHLKPLTSLLHSLQAAACLAQWKAVDIKESGILGPDPGRHWYYRVKAEAVERCLRDAKFSTLLDVGAGSGFFSRHLLARTDLRAAYCVDPNYPREWRETVAGKPLYFMRSTEGVNADLVLLMDVMEHVDDDVALLREYVGKSRTDATFLISVPAFQFLWSAHDVFLGHRRRYTVSDIETSVRAAGLSVCFAGYFYSAIFPLALLVRLARRNVAQRQATSDLRPHHALVNALLLGLCRAELPLLRHNRLFGLTAFCLAKRETV